MLQKINNDQTSNNKFKLHAVYVQNTMQVTIDFKTQKHYSADTKWR